MTESVAWFGWEAGRGDTGPFLDSPNHRTGSRVILASSTGAMYGVLRLMPLCNRRLVSACRTRS
jgi:hypothetical protein